MQRQQSTKLRRRCLPVSVAAAANYRTVRRLLSHLFALSPHVVEVDALVVNTNARQALYLNDGGNRKSWIGFRLVGASSNRHAIGARIEIEAGGRTQVGEVRSGGSCLSHNDMRVHFGLGSDQRVDRIRVRWPNGFGANQE